MKGPSIRVAIFCGLISAAAAGCKARRPSDSAQVKYLVSEKHEFGLMRAVKMAAIQICIDDDHLLDPAHMNQVLNQTQASVLRWIKPLRSLSKDLLASRVTFVSDCSQADGKIVLRQKFPGPAAYVDMAIAQMNISFSSTEFQYSSDHVINHEMGHMFGLWDTYVPKGTAKQPKSPCKVGQPLSVMCDPVQFVDLQPDDVEGIRAIYRMQFSAEFKPRKETVYRRGTYVLGIVLDGDYTGAGLSIAGVEPGSPAALAELKPNDVIFAVNGKPVSSFEDLMAAVDASHGTVIIGRQSENGLEGTTTLQLPTRRRGSFGLSDSDDEGKGDEAPAEQMVRTLSDAETAREVTWDHAVLSGPEDGRAPDCVYGSGQAAQ